MGAGLTTLPLKKLTVTETGNVDNVTIQSEGVAAGTTMTLLGQSRQEAQRPIGPIVGMRPRQRRETESIGQRA